MDQTAIMVLTNVDQTVLGEKTFNTTNGIKIPAAAPTENRGIGFVNKVLGVYDTAALKQYLSAQLGVGGWIWNGRLVNSSNRVKLVGDDGNDPSSTNPVIVCVPSNTAGKWFVGAITSAKGFDYQGAADSDIIGEEFGVTTGVAWGNARPFAGYIVNQNDSDAGLEVAISPNPAAQVSPATTNIGYLDVPATTPSDGNFFFWTSTNVTATHNAKPCFRFCSFRMTMNSSDDWAATAFDNRDGIDYNNPYNFGIREYNFPQGQMGASASRHWQPNGGTVPQFTTNVYNFRVCLDGRIKVFFFFNADGGTDGATAVNSRIALPYTSFNATNINYSFVGFAQNPTISQITEFVNNNNTNYLEFFYNNSATTTVNWLNSNFSAGARAVWSQGEYSAF